MKVGDQRPGGRAARVRQAVTAAVVKELLTVGYARLRVAAVAADAGVHKTTVYRRWPTREDLVVDALRNQTASGVIIPDSGEFQQDLLQFARAVNANLRSPTGGGLLRTFIAESAAVPEIAAVAREFWGTRFQLAGQIVTRAVDRGDVPPGTDPNRVLEALVAPIFFRTLVLMGTVDDRFLIRHATDVLQATKESTYVRR